MAALSFSAIQVMVRNAITHSKCTDNRVSAFPKAISETVNLDIESPHEALTLLLSNSVERLNLLKWLTIQKFESEADNIITSYGLD